ncbi:hypothetical protein lerEdw1_015586 [Lerista edwardsae]|nr:hypothetical protein lerEdw1_015586 [Lerista edwardsae]
MHLFSPWRGGFPIHTPELLSRLDRGEEAWVPDLQSSEDSSDEGPVKPTLKRMPKHGAWWDRYRNPVMYHSSDFSNSDDEQESETEEEKPQRGGPRLILLHRNLLANSKGSLKPRETCKSWLQLKKFSRSQAAKIKNNIAEAGDINESIAKEKISEVEQWYACPSCDSDNKMTTKYSSLTCTSPQKAKLPYVCLKCGKHFSENYYFKRHQKIHSGTKPFSCTTCGKAFIQTWHLRRHEKIHLKKTHRKQPKVPEVNCVFSHSTNDLFSLEKDPVKIKPQMASRTIERNTSQDIKEGETGPLAVLIEGSEVRVSQSSEREEMCINAKTELQVFSSRKPKGKAQQNQGVVRQLEKLRRKLTRKGNVLQGYKQDQRYLRQPAQPRKSSKNACGLQGCKKEKGCASQRLGLQTMTTRKSKRETPLARKQAKSCFCQVEKPEVTPGRKSKNPQTLANTCKRPQKRPHMTVSSKLPKKAPKFCKPTSPCFDPPYQSTFLPDSKMASVEQRMELQEVLEREPKKSSVSWSCKAKKADSCLQKLNQACVSCCHSCFSPTGPSLWVGHQEDPVLLGELNSGQRT